MVGSAVFVIVLAATSASVRIVVESNELHESVRAGALHGARHEDETAAQRIASEVLPGRSVDARRGDGSIVVNASSLVPVAHPEGKGLVAVVAAAEVPLAPFRSDR